MIGRQAALRAESGRFLYRAMLVHAEQNRRTARHPLDIPVPALGIHRRAQAAGSQASSFAFACSYSSALIAPLSLSSASFVRSFTWSLPPEPPSVPAARRT